MPRPPASASASVPASASASPPTADPLRPLTELGLTPLEAAVYRFLLGAPGSTGYRIAQATGKPVGNIYKAVEALEAKGAVLTTDDGGNRVARAVAVDEWLRLRTRAFEKACADAAEALAATPESEADDGLYRLHTLEQAMERARTVISRAQRVVVTTVAPDLVASLASELHAAALRGVAVAVKAFAPCDIPGAEVVLDPRGLAAVDGAPGQWLVLNVDGRESVHLLVAHGSGELLTASWSANPLLGWAHYSGIASDIILAALRRSIASRGSSTELSSELSSELDRLQRFEIADTAGKSLMARRYRAPGRRGRKE